MQCINNAVIVARYEAVTLAISKYASKNNSHQNLMVSSIVAGSVCAFIMLFQTADYAVRRCTHSGTTKG